MTVDDRLVLDVEDILAVQVECKHCHATITSTLEKWAPREAQCPNCSETLWYQEGSDLKDMRALSVALRALLNSRKKEDGVRVRFQVKRFPEGGTTASSKK